MGLARAVFGNPSLIVMDEPNSNLDMEGDRALIETLVALKQSGAAVLMVSHRPSVLQVTDLLLALKPGGLLAFGPRDDVLRHMAEQSGQAPPPQPAAPPPAAGTGTGTAVTLADSRAVAATAPPLALLSSPPPPARDRAGDYGGSVLAGWLIVAVTFGGLGAWATLAPLTTAVISQGTFVVDGQRKSVQHLEGGIVREIRVREGEVVAEGQPLVLFDEKLQASSALMQVKLDIAVAQEARLEAERSAAAAVRFPDSMTARLTSSADVRGIIDNQRRLFEARRTSREGQAALLRNRIEQSRQQINGLSILEQSLARQAELIRKELAGQQLLGEKGFSSQNKILALQRDVARLEGERGQSLASMAQIRQNISESELQILQLDKQFREEIEKELRDVQAQRFDLDERLHALADQQSRLVVRAPNGGAVVDLAVHTVGGVVSPGGRLLDIVPQDERLMVEVKVEPNAIDNLHIGLPAEVRLSAFNRGTTPTLHGTVAFVSADRMVNQRTEQPYFLVRVAVDKQEAKSLDGIVLSAGMPAEVMINKGSRTLLDYFFKPLKQVLDKAMKE